MTELERLYSDQVVAINSAVCEQTDENSQLLDPGEIAAAVERPWSGVGEEEFYPSLYDKAGALLHAIAARQVFENGNKRTAWAAAVAFLELNGVDIGSVQPIHAEAFVIAVSTAHDFAEAQASEWFRVTHDMRRRGEATDPRVDYLALAWATEVNEDLPGGVRIDGIHARGIGAPTLPAPTYLSLVGRIFWHERDRGRTHTMEMQLAQPKGARIAAPLQKKNWRLDLDEPLPSQRHSGGFHPLFIAQPFAMSLITTGSSEIVVYLDGTECARLPFEVYIQPSVPDTARGL